MNLAFLVSLLFVLSMVSAIPVACDRSTIPTLEADEEALVIATIPCEDHHVCRIHCGFYFPKCSKMIDFNVDPLVRGARHKGQNGYEEYKAYNLVCVNKAFSYESYSSKMIFQTVNAFLSQYTRIPLAAFNEILSHPVHSWDIRYYQLIQRSNLSEQQKLVASALKAMGVALRNFKKHCPSKTKDIHQLWEKFKAFEHNYWVKMIQQGNANDDPGLRAYQQLQEIYHKTQTYQHLAAQNHYMTVVYHGQLVKHFNNAHTNIALYHQNLHLYHVTRNPHFFHLAQHYLSGYHYENAKFHEMKVKYDEFIKKFHESAHFHHQWAVAIHAYNTNKIFMMDNILRMYLNPAFQHLGGNLCECVDFYRFYTWNNAMDAHVLYQHYGIRKNIVRARFDNYLHQMKIQCQRRC